MTIGITGGTGFIGKHLTALLVSKGYNVTVFTRSVTRKESQQVAYAHWDIDKKACDFKALKDLDAVVHLAGANVAEKRLTEKRKQEVIASRVESAEFLLGMLKEHAPCCKTFISASGVGYYGPDRTGIAPFTETDPPYNDFIGETCRQWEAATQKASSFLRTVIFRIGIVLGKDGGAYPQLAAPLSFGLLPILGSGQQVVSWISVDDLVQLVLFAIEQKGMAGIYNAVSPLPVTHAVMMGTIGRAKKGIHIRVPAPSLLLRLMLGNDMANEVLKSCTVSAVKVLGTGFTFEYPDIESAIEHIGKK